MRIVVILPTIVFSIMTAAAFYFNDILLVLLALPLLFIQYFVTKSHEIVDQESLNAYIKHAYGISCEGIISFTEDLELYLYFPSKMKDNTAMVSRDKCVIKINGTVKSMEVYEGIEEAVTKLCKPRINKISSLN
ncbi:MULTISPECIES: hypothetical protein [Metallosphaera]|uniref:Uncharacterized protein n=3 Tax=Metallosphaera TaxID=41980 RepID=A4YGE2_METS5|nr:MULTISPECIES: hypothetical protein [Metallosphaera]ABP95494.1 hypothetical protein Msed_1336 [Metallosphaera sedula DSM 5348]AIM27479.1 hypothetical protein HA72_1336 [Metallosphaera sedula]AKV74349.1 hypothetical protein MsedA_1354 [Metallosphaera sedula]AKV76588.1 hypothetical protein MsedB_1356 [Metallosphaera sedula]AKV78840.1 hypothetical protein MsedC_1354 [Metallosphaera sedula]